MIVKYLDLSVNEVEHRRALHIVLEKLLEEGRFVAGKSVSDFENLIKLESRCYHALALSSGTAAVWVALRLVGVGPGDEVITSALGWMGSINPIFLCGAVPRFVDIGSNLNISPAAVRSAITPNTKAILAVHYTGLPCNLTELKSIALEHGISLIEDCAQAYGAQWEGQPVGSFGEVGAFSMNPMKLFAALGEAGCVVFNRDEWVEKASALRHNGLHNAEDCMTPSLNLKPDSLQCGFLLAKHKWLGKLMNRRFENANLYNAALSGYVQLPESQETSSRVYYTYTIRAERRDELQHYLANKSIETKVRHPILLNEQYAYSKLGGIGSVLETPEADLARKEILSLPVHEKITSSDIKYVCDAIKQFYRKK